MNEILPQILRFSNESEKIVFHWEKQNFEPIGNSTHKAEFLALGKARNIYIDYLMFCPSRQNVK